jgi:hypothetical protein
VSCRGLREKELERQNVNHATIFVDGVTSLSFGPVPKSYRAHKSQKKKGKHRLSAKADLLLAVRALHFMPHVNKKKEVDFI